MPANIWTYVQGFAPAPFYLALLVTLLRFRRWGTWPSLIAICANQLAADAVLPPLLPHRSAYFFAFYTWSWLTALLRLWLMADVVRTFRSARFIGISVPLFFISAGSVLAATAAWVSWHAGSNFTAHRGPLPLVGAVLLDRAVNVAWAAFLVSALVGLRVFRITWGRAAALACNGLLVTSGGAMVCRYAFTVLPPRWRQLGDAGQSIIAIAGAVVWCKCAATPLEAPEYFGKILDRFAVESSAH